MTMPCRPYHLFWEPLPDGVAIYAFGRPRLYEQDWLEDKELFDLIETLEEPTVHLDLRFVQCLGAMQFGRIVQLGRRAWLRGGSLVLWNLSAVISECVALLRLDRLNWLRFEAGDNPHGTICFPDPAWLAWNRGLVPALASTIRESQDHALLPILGDALEEAGCTSQGLLDHLHGPGPHRSGCFALELLLTSCRRTGA